MLGGWGDNTTQPIFVPRLHFEGQQGKRSLSDTFSCPRRAAQFGLVFRKGWMNPARVLSACPGLNKGGPGTEQSQSLGPAEDPQVGQARVPLAAAAAARRSLSQLREPNCLRETASAVRRLVWARAEPGCGAATG